jgi:peptidylprolyl isomerase
VVAAFGAARSASARAYLTRILRRIGSGATIALLVDAVAHDRDIIARAEAARALGRVPLTPEVLVAIVVAIRDAATQVGVYAAQSLARFGAAAASKAPEVTAHYRAASSPWLKAELLTALVAIDKAAARPLVDTALRGKEPLARIAAVGALAAYATQDDLTTLAGLVSDADVRVAAGAIDALGTVDPARIPAATKEKLRAALGGHDIAIVSSTAAAAVAFGWKDFAPDLARAYDGFVGPTGLDGRVAILGALGALGSAADVPLVERGLADAERTVVAAAADAYKALTGADVSGRIPLASRVDAETPSGSEITRALAKSVLLVTNRGVVWLRMLPDAPLSATNFVQLVERGFYNGRTFHRVVPDFVAQGGDPRGDGYGGSDALVREEIARVPHRRGTVGMATSGKDTASAQFFINHGWNVSLDGNYTVFAEVASGMDVVDRLEIGDTIAFALAL